MLSDVIGKRVRLTRAGREFKGCCPFHNEKTPSFYVNDDKQFFHCFGCGAHGDAVGFVMRHDNLSFIESVESLAGLAGMQVPKASPQDVEKSKQEKSLYSLLEDATKWMEVQLRAPEHRAAYDYMIGRNVSEELLASFRVGYAPADGQAIRQHLLKQGYTDGQMIEAGVTRRSDRAKDPYAFFRERIIFPVPDRRGRVVAFGGRILPDHLRPPDRGDFKPPKYINSSDTPLFHKGRMLFGEPHARQAAGEGKPLIIVEGYLDVISAFKAGYRGALAPLGTALTEDQIMALWKMIPQTPKMPILCFDGDDAGRRAASRAAERVLPLLKPDQSVKIAFLPQGQDPDTLVNTQGEAAFGAVLSSALSLVDFLWQEQAAGREFSAPETRAGLSSALEQLALKIPDRDVQHYYRQAFRDKIRSAFTPAFTPFLKNNYKKQKDSNFSALRKPAFSKNNLIGMAILSAAINYPELAMDVEEHLAGLEFQDSGLDAVRQGVLSVLSQEDDVTSEYLKTHLIQMGCQDKLMYILSDQVYLHAAFARPGRDIADVQTALKGALDALSQGRANEDLQAARRAFMQDMTEENENRLKYLHEAGRQE